jgi:hypothetical protein
MSVGGRLKKTIDFIEEMQWGIWELFPWAQKGGVFSFGLQALVSLNENWFEQNGMT